METDNYEVRIQWNNTFKINLLATRLGNLQMLIKMMTSYQNKHKFNFPTSLPWTGVGMPVGKCAQSGGVEKCQGSSC